MAAAARASRRSLSRRFVAGGQDGRQRLERDLPSELLIVGEVDDAHAAPSDASNDAE